MFYSKIVNFLLIICLLSSSLVGILLIPNKAKASGIPVYDAANFGVNKETALNTGSTAVNTDLILEVQNWDKYENKMTTHKTGGIFYGFVYALLTELTNDMVGWLNQTGSGLPRFLATDLGDWMTDTANQASGIFIEQYLGAGWLCDSFYGTLNDMFKLRLTIPKYKQIDYDVECTIEDVLDNAGTSLEKFEDDFAEGDWDAWVEFTQKENTFYGTYWESVQADLAMRNQAQEEQDKELAMNDGYQNQKDCVWYDAAGAEVETQKDIVGIPAIPADCQADPDNPGITVGGYAMPCYYHCEVLTPGSTIKDMSSETVNNYWRQLNDQLNALLEKSGPNAPLIMIIAKSLFNEFFKEDSGGLRYAGEIDTPTSTPGGDDLKDAIKLEVALTKVDDKLDTAIPLAEDNAKGYQQVKDYYQNQTIPALEEVINECGANSNAGNWAQNQINGINNNILPSIQDKIDRPNDLKQAQSEIKKAMSSLDKWYSDLKNDQLKQEIIDHSQAGLALINGQSSATTFGGLAAEAETAAENLDALIQTMRDEQKTYSPPPGSIAAEMEKAKSTKNDADEKSKEC